MLCHQICLFFHISFHSVACDCVNLGPEGEYYYMTVMGEVEWVYMYIHIVNIQVYLVVILDLWYKMLFCLSLIFMYIFLHSFIVHSVFINFHKIIHASVLHFVMTVINCNIAVHT